MKIKKCALCNQLFPDMGTVYCPGCMEKMDDQFLIVRDYLYDNPNASIEEVSENTQVSSKLIIHFLKEGRLSVANASGFLRCEQCGESIDTGRFCKACAQRIDERVVKPLIASMKNRKTKDVGPKMHTGKGSATPEL